jgi:hypothetical protein
LLKEELDMYISTTQMLHGRLTLMRGKHIGIGSGIKRETPARRHPIKKDQQHASYPPGKSGSVLIYGFYRDGPPNRHKPASQPFGLRSARRRTWKK